MFKLYIVGNKFGGKKAFLGPIQECTKLKENYSKLNNSRGT